MANLDVSKHFLSFKHEKVGKKELDALIKKYDISVWDLPKILITDPAIKDMGLKPGDVVKIYRKCPYRGPSIYYRVVVRE
ncbi:MAG: DNA-directed polymerase subunit [Candidatus Woesearchaeota archaeon]|nr:DNA-directed polymerase subunit [Candidatus Woesearchaeota archaeon]MDN5328018.1 DNA-directed polymerase subunit [Candidatus Woesearchaeota archaeon]